MIAGRLNWHRGERKLGNKMDLCLFDFGEGTLALTEAGSKKRASLHMVRGRDGLAEFDRGGLEALDATPRQFAERLRGENRTLKRALTDPTRFSGIGNAYSDEILHRARLSPASYLLSHQGRASVQDARRWGCWRSQAVCRHPQAAYRCAA